MFFGADGVDPKELQRRLTQANPEERRRLMWRYVGWVFQGTRAQGWYQAGIVLLGASAMLAIVAVRHGQNDAWLYPVAILALAAGAWLSLIAFRREREWRRSHPFKYEDDDA